MYRMMELIQAVLGDVDDMIFTDDLWNGSER